jgi:hypothetical protein
VDPWSCPCRATAGCRGRAIVDTGLIGSAQRDARICIRPGGPRPSARVLDQSRQKPLNLSGAKSVYRTV